MAPHTSAAKEFYPNSPTVRVLTSHSTLPSNKYIDGVYPNQISRADARRELGIAPNQAVLLYLGIIGRYKGLDLDQLIVNQLKDAELVLLIAGSPHPHSLCSQSRFRRRFSSCFGYVT